MQEGDYTSAHVHTLARIVMKQKYAGGTQGFSNVFIFSGDKWLMLKPRTTSFLNYSFQHTNVTSCEGLCAQMI